MEVRVNLREVTNQASRDEEPRFFWMPRHSPTLPLADDPQVDTLGSQYKSVNLRRKNLGARITDAIVLEIQRSDGGVLVG